MAHNDWWYAVQVESGAELEVVDEINSYVMSSIYAWCPTIKKKEKLSRFQKRKPDIIEVPIFGRWIFVCYYGEPNWFEVTGIRKVQGFLAVNAQPLPIREREIVALRREVDAGAYNDKLVGSNYQEGDKIEIALGEHVFGGMKGTFQKLTSSRVAEVELQLLGRCTKVEIPTKLIEKIF